ncbi:MAG: GHKL domain-containing protein [Oscillospiraceae bacterium]
MTGLELGILVGTTTLYTLVFLFFVLAPFRSKLRFSLKTTLIIAAIYTLLSLYLFVMGFDRTNMIPGFFPLPLLVWLVLTIGGCFLCIKSAPGELLFSIFIILNVQANVLVVSKVVRNVFLVPHIGHLLFEGSKYIVGSLIFAFVFVPMLYYLFIGLLKKVVEFRIEFRYWRYLWLLPMIFYVLSQVGGFGGIARDGLYTTRDFIVLILSNAAQYASVIVCLQMLIKTHENIMVTERAKFMEQQLRLEKNEYTKLVERITETDHQRHDLRHHVRALSGYLQEGEYAEAQKYLSRYAEETLQEGEPSVCANKAADYLLRHFIVQARQTGAEVSCRIYLPEVLAVADTDLSVVLGNLLENAVVALQSQQSGKKTLTVCGELVGHQLALSVENSYSGALDLRDGVYYSTKHEGEGIGLSSVRGIIEHSGGSFQITAEKGIFTADVLMNF